MHLYTVFNFDMESYESEISFQPKVMRMQNGNIINKAFKLRHKIQFYIPWVPNEITSRVIVIVLKVIGNKKQAHTW